MGKTEFRTLKIFQVMRHDGAGPSRNSNFQNEVIGLILEIRTPEVAHLNVVSACYQMGKRQFKNRISK